MSLNPPVPEKVGDIWVDPMTANRYEWDGTDWVNLGWNGNWGWDAVLRPPTPEGGATDGS